MIDAKSSHKTNLIVTTIIVLIVFFWNRYGNFKTLIGNYSEVIVSCVCILIVLYTSLINVLKSQYKLIRMLLFILITTIPILTLVKIQLVSSGFIIVYCVGVSAVCIIFQDMIKVFFSRYWIQYHLIFPASPM